MALTSPSGTNKSVTFPKKAGHEYAKAGKVKKPKVNKGRAKLAMRRGAISPKAAKLHLGEIG